MSTTMTVPAHILARQQARAESETKSAIMTAVISGDGFAFPKISVRGGRYRLVEDGVETIVGTSLSVVIVGANPNVSKVFYSKPFDGALDVRPDCYSNDGVRPDASVQAPVSQNCQSCPHNVLGSKVNPSGAKSKMCGDQRHLAVVPAADPKKVYALTIPVSGMKGLREYFKDLQNYGLSPEEVITELGFDDTANYPKIVFSHKGYVPEKAIASVDAIVASDEVKEVVRLIPPTQRHTALSAPETQSAPALAKAPEPEVVAAEPEVAPEPPKAAKPAKVAKPPVEESSEPIPGIDALESKLDALFAED